MNIDNCNSKSILYVSLSNEAERRIDELKSINLNMTDYENRLKNIRIDIYKETCEEEDFTEDNQNTDKKQDPNAYENTILRLENLISELKEYEKYYVLARKAENLTEQLLNKEGFNYDNIIKEAGVILDKIESLPTDDYDRQKSAIDISYEGIYNVLKLESLFDFDNISSRVKENNTHSSYISKLILNECNMSQDKLLLARLHSLQAQGMDNNILIDKELLKLLAINTNKEYINIMKEKVRKAYEEYKDNISGLKGIAESTETKAMEYNEYSNKAKRNIKMIVKKSLALITCLGTGVIVGLTINGFARKENRLYYTHSIEYDSNTGETVDKGYDWEKYNKENVTIEVEFPWEYSKRNEEYSKLTQTHTMKSIPGTTDLKEYVKLAGKQESTSSNIETIKTKPENFDEIDTKYKVLIKEFDNKYINNEPTSSDSAFAFLMGFICTLLSLLIYLRVSNSTIAEWVEDYQSNKKYRDQKAEEMEEEIKKLNDILEKCKEQIDSILENPFYNIECPEISQESEIDNILESYAPNVDRKKLIKVKSLSTK